MDSRFSPGTASTAASDPADTQAVRRRRVFVLLAITAATFSVAPIRNCLISEPLNKDYTLWYLVAQVVRINGDIYPHDPRPFPFMYPPAAATLLAVASLVGETAFVVGLTLLQSAAWFAAVLLSVRLATGRAWGQHPMLYLVPSLCVVPFIHDMYLLGQPNLGLLALMLGALVCLKVNRPWAAGGLVALATGIKAFPVLAVGWLLYRGYYKATAAFAVALFVLMLVLPAGLFRGVDRAVDDLATWTRGMVFKYDADTIAQRPERSYSFKNQSIIAVGNRLLRPVLADGEADKQWRVNVVSLDFRTVNAAIVAAAGLLAAFALVTAPRRDRRTDRSDAAEGAVLLLLIVMFSPLSFNYAYVWLIYPLTVALHAALSAPDGSRERVALFVWIAAAVAVLALALPLPRLAQAYGNLFATGLILLIGLGLLARRWAAPAVA
jgi:Glycosyltransferase family 87